MKARIENINQPSTWQKGEEYDVANFCKLLLNYKYTNRKARLFLCKRSWQRDNPEANAHRRVKTEFVFCPISQILYLLFLDFLQLLLYIQLT